MKLSMAQLLEARQGEQRFSRRETINHGLACPLNERIGCFQHSTHLSERIARDFAQQGQPSIVPMPTSPVDVVDLERPPVGQTIGGCLNCSIYGYEQNRLTMADLEGVATGAPRHAP